MKRHLAHLASCAPMIVIAGVGAVTGARLSCLALMLGCIAAMVVMMSAMDHRRPEPRDATRARR